MQSKLEMYAMETTYEDVKLLIYSTVHKHIKKYGGSFEEALAEAQHLFLLAYRDYRPEAGPFDNWIRIRVRYGLIGVVRKSAMRDARCKQFNMNMDAEPFLAIDNDGGSYSHERLADLSEDARAITMLILDTPTDLLGLPPCRIRKAVKNYLRELGWTTSRVNHTLKDLQVC